MSVTASLRNGTTARGKAFANTVAKTPRVKVSLWIMSDEPLLGITYRFTRDKAHGTLRINSRSIGPAFDDTTQAIAFPRVITPEQEGDWGGTVVVGALPPGLYKVATFDITVLGSKPATEYGFWLDSISMVALPDDREKDISATFFIRRQ